MLFRSRGWAPPGGESRTSHRVLQGQGLFGRLAAIRWGSCEVTVSGRSRRLEGGGGLLRMCPRASLGRTRGRKVGGDSDQGGDRKCGLALAGTPCPRTWKTPPRGTVSTRGRSRLPACRASPRRFGMAGLRPLGREVVRHRDPRPLTGDSADWPSSRRVHNEAPDFRCLWIPVLT